MIQKLSAHQDKPIRGTKPQNSLHQTVATNLEAAIQFATQHIQTNAAEESPSAPTVKTAVQETEQSVPPAAEFKVEFAGKATVPRNRTSYRTC